MGRTKEPKQAPAKMAEILPAKVEAIEAAQEANALAVERQAQEEQAELIELAVGVGGIQMADVAAKFCAAAQIQLFKRIKESKKIKDLPLRDASGNLRRAQTLEDFCPLAFGRSYRAMMDAEERFDLLGEQAYETAARLGLNRSALRAARALPPEKLEAVRLAIGSGGTKAEVLSVIEDLAEKAQQAEAATVEVRKEWDADKDLLATKNNTIDRLQREIRRIEKLPADKQLVLLKKEATAIAADAEGAILGGLRQALIALNDHPGSDPDRHAVFAAGLVGQVQSQLNALREEFNLPDASTLAERELASEVAEWAYPKGKD